MTPRTRDADASRAALIRAASKAFAVAGFTGARTQEIADAAGVNKALIKYHFGNKQGLYSAVVLDHIVRGQESIAESMPGADASPPERLDAFLLAMGRCVEEQPDFVPIIMREQMDGARHIEPAVRERFFGFFGMVRAILEEGIAEGHFRRLDPHATHLSLIGSLMFYKLTEPARATYRHAGAMPSPVPAWGDYVDHVRTLFAIGLQAEGETGAANDTES